LLAQARGDLSTAQRLLEQSVETFKREGSARAYLTAQARLELAAVVLERGDTQYATELLDDVASTTRADMRSLRERAKALRERLGDETP
jgi:Tfp pilus assembly protein PilF